MIAKMCKIEVVGVKKRLPQLLEKIQSLGVLHVDEVPLLSPRPGRFELHRIPLTAVEEEEQKKMEQAEENLDEVARMMSPAVRQLIQNELWRTDAKPDYKEPLDKLVEAAKKILEEASGIHKKETELREELRILENYESILESIGSLVDKSGTGGGRQSSRYIGITVAKEEKAVFRVLEEELAKITNKSAQIFKGDEGKKNIAALIGFPAQFEQKVKDFIWNQGISEIKLPSGFQDKPLKEAVQGLKNRIADLPKEIAKAEQAMAAFSEKQGRNVLVWRAWCQTKLKRLEVVENLAQSHYAVVLVGWLPEKDLEHFRDEIKKEFKDEVVVNRLVPGRRDYGRVPVALQNSRWMRPFELLIKIFPPPLYGTIDVTTMIGLVFPFFFGYILGDVFYGLVLGGLALMFRKKWKDHPILKQALVIMYACTATSILFGFLFGEFLGDFGHHYLGMKPILFNREIDILTSLYVAIGIGIGHVFLGLALGVYVAAKSGDRHGVWANGAFLGCIAAVMVILAAVMGLVPVELGKAGGWALAVLLPVSMWLHGPMALLEVVSVLGNMLSYARLMAIGLASVILAVVANKFVTLFGSVIFGLLIAVLLHALNFALGVFAPAVQSLRLHYVEFFMKFYKPEGRTYQPFAIAK